MTLKPQNRRPLNREGLRTQRRDEAKVAPTLGRAENARALRRLAAAGYMAAAGLDYLPNWNRAPNDTNLCDPCNLKRIVDAW